jgi:DNA segregation ATPase FtsK/SpoIIIE-like protein
MGRISRLIFTICLALILWACEGGVGGDPVSQLEQARREKESAERAIQDANARIAEQQFHLEETKAAAEAYAVQQYANLTATAGAQNLEATRSAATQYAVSTANAQATEIAGGQATGTAVAGATQTAWPPTATIVAATQAAQSTMTAATQAAELRRQRDQEMWDSFNTWIVTPLKMAFWPAFGILFLIGLTILFVYFARLVRKELPGLISLLKLNMMMVRRENGQSPLYPTYLPGGRIAWVDLDKAVGPVTILDPDGLVRMMGIVDQEWQRTHNRGEQMIKAIGAFPPGGGSAGVAANVAGEMLGANQPTQNATPSMAPWEILVRWSNPESIPIGMGQRGAIELIWEKHPHLIIAGTSGSGKSRRILIPVMSDALIRGREVLLLNAKGGDFSILRGHPNLSEYHAHDTDARQVAEILEKVSAEVWERSKILDQAGVSTWSRLPREMQRQRSYLLVVVDELVNLVFGAEADTGTRIWRAVIRIANIGRAMNVSFVTATTDPTEKTLGRLGMVARSNFTPILFQVMSGAISQALLGQYGAEKLPEGHFMTRLGTEVIEGVAYDPKGSDVRNLLESRPIPALPQSTWQDQQLPPPGRESSRLAFDPDVVQRVLGLGRMDPQPSLNEIQRQVWPGDALGGAHLETVKEILRREGLYPNGNGR